MVAIMNLRIQHNLYNALPTILEAFLITCYTLDGILPDEIFLKNQTIKIEQILYFGLFYIYFH